MGRLRKTFRKDRVQNKPIRFEEIAEVTYVEILEKTSNGIYGKVIKWPSDYCMKPRIVELKSYGGTMKIRHVSGIKQHKERNGHIDLIFGDATFSVSADENTTIGIFVDNMPIGTCMEELKYTGKNPTVRLHVETTQRNPYKHIEQLVIEETIEHLGIRTTDRRTVVTPAPSKLETASETSVEGGIGSPPLNAQISSKQKDLRKMEFDQ